MGEACSTLRRPRRRWQGNIKMDIKETERDYVDWIHLAQDKIQWQTSVNMVMNLQVPQKAGNFLNSWATISFSRGTSPYEVGYLTRCKKKIYIYIYITFITISACQWQTCICSTSSLMRYINSFRMYVWVYASSRLMYGVPLTDTNYSDLENKVITGRTWNTVSVPFKTWVTSDPSFISE
jgi:hypothetical protein